MILTAFFLCEYSQINLKVCYLVAKSVAMFMITKVKILVTSMYNNTRDVADCTPQLCVNVIGYTLHEYIAPELFLLLMTSLFTFYVFYFPLSFFAVYIIKFLPVVHLLLTLYTPKVR